MQRAYTPAALLLGISALLDSDEREQQAELRVPELGRPDPMTALQSRFASPASVLGFGFWSLDRQRLDEKPRRDAAISDASSGSPFARRF